LETVLNIGVRRREKAEAMRKRIRYLSISLVYLVYLVFLVYFAPLV